jgi:threonine dehydratase
LSRAITLDTIRAARPRVYGVAVRTPLVRLDPVSPDAPEIWLKLETLQPIGAFKIRGAANAIGQLSKDDTKDGVWTVSAGNAAQGVALAAKRAGIPCSVLVMDTAPAAKLDAIRRLGADIVQAPYDECWHTVETHANSRMRGHFVHPFDDDAFISGNGTAGLEIL